MSTKQRLREQMNSSEVKAIQERQKQTVQVPRAIDPLVGEDGAINK